MTMPKFNFPFGTGGFGGFGGFGDQRQDDDPISAVQGFLRGFGFHDDSAANHRRVEDSLPPHARGRVEGRQKVRQRFAGEITGPVEEI